MIDSMLEKTNRADNAIDVTQTIGAIVAEDISRAEVFKKYNIDFCCGGKRTLDEACTAAGVDVNEITQLLVARNEPVYRAAHQFAEWPLHFLADYIYNTHHRYIRASAGELTGLATKVALRHGMQHPHLNELRDHLQQFLNNMLEHLQEEESVVFPYIKQLVMIEHNAAAVSMPSGNSIQSPIALMEAEHQASGEDLTFFRELTNDYTLPEDACNTCRLFFRRMQEFEEDLFQHIHLENNLLFPKALALEQQLFPNAGVQ